MGIELWAADVIVIVVTPGTSPGKGRRRYGFQENIKIVYPHAAASS